MDGIRAHLIHCNIKLGSANYGKCKKEVVWCMTGDTEIEDIEPESLGQRYRTMMQNVCRYQ